MAKVWIVYRQGLRVMGAALSDVALEPTISRIDIAPWRLFCVEAPEQVPLEQVHRASRRKRVLVQVTAQDRYDLCGLTVGFFESPYAPDECIRRLGLADHAEAAPA